MSSIFCEKTDEKKSLPKKILIYKVFSDRMEFFQKLDNPLLVSPNDLAATSSGEIFVTNDAEKKGAKLKHCSN